jgi:hypothetical protein
MKTLSLTQPWASLVVLGVKQLETRRWQTKHRGPLAIHAGKNYPSAARILCLQEPWRSALQEAGVDVWAKLPRGCLLGMVDLIDCIRVEEFGEVPAKELPLGDFRPGRWIWRLTNARPFADAVPYPGRLGLFEVSDDLLISPEPTCAIASKPTVACVQGTLYRTN